MRRPKMNDHYESQNKNKREITISLELDPNTDSVELCEEKKDIRRGFSEAELALQRWRSSQKRDHEKSRSRSSYSRRGRDCCTRKKRSRSRSRSPAPQDPRYRDHCDRKRYNDDTRSYRNDEIEESWNHDKYHEILDAPEPARPRDDYIPPEEEWFSRAGGMYVKNPRAWLNEHRHRRCSSALD